MAINLLPTDGTMELYEAAIGTSEATRMFDMLIQEVSWRSETIMMFGKPVMQPRRTALYGDEGLTYRYSGRTMHPLPWTPTLLALKAVAEAYATTSFSTVLVNLYRNGADSMGWHRDNERELGPHPTIASISLGTTRLFQCKHRTDPSLRVSLPLTNGSLLVMKGAMQEQWYHQIPKERRVTEPRINLTFRAIQGTV
jgi:alkylated DNA repair dioxygenase AlkB